MDVSQSLETAHLTRIVMLKWMHNIIAQVRRRLILTSEQRYFRAAAQRAHSAQVRIIVPALDVGPVPSAFHVTGSSSGKAAHSAAIAAVSAPAMAAQHAAQTRGDMWAELFMHS